MDGLVRQAVATPPRLRKDVADSGARGLADVVRDGRASQRGDDLVVNQHPFALVRRIQLVGLRIALLARLGRSRVPFEVLGPCEVRLTGELHPLDEFFERHACTAAGAFSVASRTLFRWCARRNSCALTAA